MQENTQELPHLVVDEPKRSKWAITGIAVLSLMLLAVPVGIFLVSRPTQLAPQAATVAKPQELSAGIFLESKLSPESRGGIIPVDVYVKSPVDPINLVNAQIEFDPNLINIDKIATNGAEVANASVFNKWIEVSKDLGNVEIIAGLPTPGIVNSGSNPNEERTYLATLYLTPKAIGDAVLQISPNSQLLRNSDNQNIFKSGSDLVLNLTSIVSEATSSAAVIPSTGKSVGNDHPIIVITDPVTASNYSYFKPVEIIWSSFNVSSISQINLFINGESFGPISQSIDASKGKFTWQPQESLALPYIQLSNTYQIEIIGASKTGETVKTLSGPFGIVGTEDVAGGLPDPQAFSQNQLTISDASRILSNYLVSPPKDKSLDLNNDNVINGLDFYLLRQNLLGRGLIK